MQDVAGDEGQVAALVRRRETVAFRRRGAHGGRNRKGRGGMETAEREARKGRLTAGLPTPLATVSRRNGCGYQGPEDAEHHERKEETSHQTATPHGAFIAWHRSIPCRQKAPYEPSLNTTGRGECLTHENRGVGSAYEIRGMDCAEEIAILKREIGSLVGGADRLGFDLLKAKMTVASVPEGVGPEAIVAAVRHRLGGRAVGVRSGARQAGAALAAARANPADGGERSLGLGGFSVHAALAGGVSEIRQRLEETASAGRTAVVVGTADHVCGLISPRGSSSPTRPPLPSSV